MWGGRGAAGGRCAGAWVGTEGLAAAHRPHGRRRKSRSRGRQCGVVCYRWCGWPVPGVARRRCAPTTLLRCSICARVRSLDVVVGGHAQLVAGRQVQRLGRSHLGGEACGMRGAFWASAAGHGGDLRRPWSLLRTPERLPGATGSGSTVLIAPRGSQQALQALLASRGLPLRKQAGHEASEAAS